MPYTKYNDPWVNADSATGGGDESTPLTAAALNYIEAGIEAAAAAADAAIPAPASPSTNDGLFYNGSAWVADTINNAKIAANAAIAVSKLAAGSDGEILATSGSASQWVDPNSLLGQVQSYTPAWTSTSTQPSLGNGSISGKYIKFGKLIYFTVGLTLGSTTTVGTGIWLFSVPVPIHNEVAIFPGSTSYVDTSAGGTYYGPLLIKNTSTTVFPTIAGSPISTPSSTVPFTWASTDVLRISAMYYTT